MLLDENHFRSDEIQAITYQMCHMNARGTRSLSVPAPVYYADLAAKRAKILLAGEIGDNCSNSGSDLESDSGSDSESDAGSDGSRSAPFPTRIPTHDDLADPQYQAKVKRALELNEKIQVNPNLSDRLYFV